MLAQLKDLLKNGHESLGGADWQQAAAAGASKLAKVACCETVMSEPASVPNSLGFTVQLSRRKVQDLIDSGETGPWSDWTEDMRVLLGPAALSVKRDVFVDPVKASQFRASIMIRSTVHNSANAQKYALSVLSGAAAALAAGDASESTNSKRDKKSKKSTASESKSSKKKSSSKKGTSEPEKLLAVLPILDVFVTNERDPKAWPDAVEAALVEDVQSGALSEKAARKAADSLLKSKELEGGGPVYCVYSVVPQCTRSVQSELRTDLRARRLGSNSSALTSEGGSLASTGGSGRGSAYQRRHLGAADASETVSEESTALASDTGSRMASRRADLWGVQVVHGYAALTAAGVVNPQLRLASVLMVDQAHAKYKQKEVVMLADTPVKQQAGGKKFGQMGDVTVGGVANKLISLFKLSVPTANGGSSSGLARLTGKKKEQGSPDRSPASLFAWDMFALRALGDDSWYAAPEQFSVESGRLLPSKRSSLWSLGIVLLEMFSHQPFGPRLALALPLGVETRPDDKPKDPNDKVSWALHYPPIQPLGLRIRQLCRNHNYFPETASENDTPPAGLLEQFQHLRHEAISGSAVITEQHVAWVHLLEGLLELIPAKRVDPMEWLRANQWICPSLLN